MCNPGSDRCLIRSPPAWCSTSCTASLRRRRYCPGASTEVLTGLTRAFGVSGAGTTSSVAGPSRVEHSRPPGGGGADLDRLAVRCSRAKLPAALRSGAAATEGVGGAGECYLLAAVPGPEGHLRLLWLEEPAGRVWTDTEKAALLLAGQVLGRSLPPESDGQRLAHLDQAHVQQRLLDAAVMSGRVAHAFDNVLTGIVGFAELTLSQTADATLQQYLGEVLQAAQAGIQLTQQLHLFNRCAVRGSGPTRLALVVADEEIRLRQTLDSRVEFKVDLPADLPPVALDAEPLRHVIGQLTDNACESLTGPGTVRLSARRVEVDATACADLYGRPRRAGRRNHGRGQRRRSECRARHRLFREPFFTTKPRHRGLGLAVVYRILQRTTVAFSWRPAPGRDCARGSTCRWRSREFPVGRGAAWRTYLPEPNTESPS